MNSKSTNKASGKPAGKTFSRPEAREGGKPAFKGKPFRPSERPEAGQAYGRYREEPPADRPAPPRADRPASRPPFAPGGFSPGRPSATQGGRPVARPSSPPQEGYPAAKPPPPRPVSNPAPALIEALKAVTADVKTLKSDLAQKDVEIKALQKRLTQMEARQKSQEKALRAPQVVEEVAEERPAE